MESLQHYQLRALLVYSIEWTCWIFVKICQAFYILWPQIGQHAASSIYFWWTRQPFEMKLGILLSRERFWKCRVDFTEDRRFDPIDDSTPFVHGYENRSRKLPWFTARIELDVDSMWHCLQWNGERLLQVSLHLLPNARCKSMKNVDVTLETSWGVIVKGASHPTRKRKYAPVQFARIRAARGRVRTQERNDSASFGINETSPGNYYWGNRYRIVLEASIKEVKWQSEG